MGHGTNHELFVAMAHDLTAIRSAQLRLEGFVKELEDRQAQRHREVVERLDRLQVLHATENVVLRWLRGRR